MVSSPLPRFKLLVQASPFTLSHSFLAKSGKMLHLKITSPSVSPDNTKFNYKNHLTCTNYYSCAASCITAPFRVKPAQSSSRLQREASQHRVGEKRVRKAPSGPNPVGNHSPTTKQ
ncbi:unnamed protein product [Linum tenue]|uniref:Uncharacterized protein n=1 Tax=Linum tenue TaxID=586396 RepID=A0AAV0PUP3_9ROSI|nr:unnamed protein product [Linum tenue]